MIEHSKKPLVVIENLGKRYADVLALENLSLTIKRGEFVTLLGPSGCGKTTTLRLLGGFEQADRGRITLDGEEVTHLPPNRRNVNMVFQDYALFPHMNVADNVAFGLQLKGMNRDAIAKRSAELFEFLQLTELTNRMPEQLSGGQRQRVALARALAPDPKLLLLDEPLGALDAKLRSQVQIELKEIQSRTGKTFIFVTHDQEEALTMSDRVIVMNNGRLMQDGSPQSLYHHPANRFVAEFIGEINLLHTRVVALDNEHWLLDWMGFQLQARASAGNSTRVPGASLNVAIRPEAIRLSGGPNGYRARVEREVFRGSQRVFDLSLNDSGSARIKATVESTYSVPRTEALYVEIDPDRIALLDD